MASVIVYTLWRCGYDTPMVEKNSWSLGRVRGSVYQRIRLAGQWSNDGAWEMRLSSQWLKGDPGINAALLAIRHRPKEVLIYQGFGCLQGARLLPQRLSLDYRHFIVRFIKYPFEVILLSHERRMYILRPG